MQSFHPALADFLGSLLTGLIPVNVQHLLMGTLTDEEKTVLTVIRLPRFFVMGLSLDRPWQQAEPRFREFFGNPLADPGLFRVFRAVLPWVLCLSLS